MTLIELLFRGVALMATAYILWVVLCYLTDQSTLEEEEQDDKDRK